MRVRIALAALVVAAAVPSEGTAASRPHLESPHGLGAARSPMLLRTGTLDAQSARTLASSDWDGGPFSTAAGTVTVYVSPAYAPDDDVAQRWADFFASLVHGPELGLLTAYFAPLDEVESLCGGEDGVLGCYANDRLVAVGDTTDGITPESVAAHEYGHHVAYHRVNAPWIALDWGPKRWATEERVCSRAALGTAFPGSEELGYTLNPGEAFAESFRVLNEMRAGGPETWPILDASFRPDANALQAVADDVVSPWAGPTVTAIRGRFATGRSVWTQRIATPLDGTLSVALADGSKSLQLLGADSHSVIASGSWTASGGRRVDATVCGERSFVVRVTRRGGPSSFVLRVSTP